MKQLKAVLLSLTILTMLFGIITCNAEKIQGTVEHEGNYYYVDFGNYNNFDYYNKLLNYLGNDRPDGLKADNNQIGFHMTIKDDNLQKGKLSDLQGKEYTFDTEDSFTEFKTGNKDWFVKKLTPLGDAKKIFKDAYHATLHASVAYVEHGEKYQMAI